LGGQSYETFFKRDKPRVNEPTLTFQILLFILTVSIFARKSASVVGNSSVVSQSSIGHLVVPYLWLSSVGVQRY